MNLQQKTNVGRPLEKCFKSSIFQNYEPVLNFKDPSGLGKIKFSSG